MGNLFQDMEDNEEIPFSYELDDYNCADDCMHIGALQNEVNYHRDQININRLIEITHENAVEKGFWEDWYECHNGTIGTPEFRIQMINNAICTRLMLIVSEVSEALEAVRKGDNENFKEELADVIIRVCDLAGELSIDLDDEIMKKINKNKDRPYKHGKKF